MQMCYDSTYFDWGTYPSWVNCILVSRVKREEYDESTGSNKQVTYRLSSPLMDMPTFENGVYRFEGLYIQKQIDEGTLEPLELHTKPTPCPFQIGEIVELFYEGRTVVGNGSRVQLLEILGNGWVVVTTGISQWPERVSNIRKCS
ncbi:hypothetical protein SHAb15599_00142 [Acinetobacter phage SH-Ab 15599]|nr:hypothetical protein SHAb15599_00142 [Acinetobacter phage SH-Ab 15599]